jgi:hypothetical protein
MIVQGITIKKKLLNFHSITLTPRQLPITTNQIGKSLSTRNTAYTTAFGIAKQLKVCEYYKFRGTSGCGQEESECRNKKFDVDKKNSAHYISENSSTEIETNNTSE